MDLHRLDIAIIAIYFIVLLAFGLWVRRIQSFGDYSVAARSAPISMIFASLSATYIGPGYTMGLAGRAYTNGYAFLLLFALFSLQTIVVGLWVAPRLRAFVDAHTLGDVMRTFYGKEVQFITGLVSFGLCCGFASVMARAGGALVSSVFNTPLWVGVALITGVGLVYTFTGGLKSVIATESFQFSIIICAVAALAIIMGSMPRVQSVNVLGEVEGFFQETPPQALFALALSFLLGETLIPPYANRALASSSGRTSRYGFVIAGLFSVGWFGVISTIGILARDVLGAGVNEDAVFIATAFQVLPSGLTGLLLVAIVAIVMSSQESVLNAGAVVGVRDIVNSATVLDGRKSVTLARVLTAVIGATSIWLALLAPSIIDGLLICYAVWAPSVLPALLWGLAGLPTSRFAGMWSVIAGVVASLSVMLSNSVENASSLALLVGLASAIFGGLAGHVADRLARPT